MRVKFTKPFRHVVGTDIHATQFTPGDTSDDARTCEVALAEGVAEETADTPAAAPDGSNEPAAPAEGDDEKDAGTPADADAVKSSDASAAKTEESKPASSPKKGAKK